MAIIIKKKVSTIRVTNAMLNAKLDKVSTSMKAVQEWMSTHEVQDNNRFKDGGEAIAALPTMQDFNTVKAAVLNDDGTEKLATKKDVEEVLQVFSNIERGAVFVQAGGKWAFRALLIFASIVAAITTIFGGWPTVVSIISNKHPQ